MLQVTAADQSGRWRDASVGIVIDTSWRARCEECDRASEGRATLDPLDSRRRELCLAPRQLRKRAPRLTSSPCIIGAGFDVDAEPAKKRLKKPRKPLGWHDCCRRRGNWKRARQPERPFARRNKGPAATKIPRDWAESLRPGSRFPAVHDGWKRLEEGAFRACGNLMARVTI